MTILVDEETRLIVQGITGRIGTVQTKLMLDYGTRIVAGVTPGKEGQTVYGVPVYDLVEDAVEEYPADASIIFVPAGFTCDAAFEAMEAGVKLIVIVTEGLPVHDALRIKAMADQVKAIVIGPNTPGVISPAKAKIGIMPANLFKEGNVGLVARSATLAYEIAGNLTEAGIGQSTCLGIGGDRVTGLTFVDVLKLFEEDEETDIVVMVGEIGRTVEEEAATYIKKKFRKPVVAFIAGRHAPSGKRMGHAGAIIERGRGTADSKIRALEDAGVEVVDCPSDVREAVSEILPRSGR